MAYTAFPNSFRRDILGRQRLIGCWCSLTNPITTDTVSEQICVLVQIESRAGLENLDGICAVEGVDGIFIGPSDLAAALGHLGNAGHSEVQGAMRDIFVCARRHGRTAGILAPVEADARRYLEQGARFVAVGSDQALFRAATGSAGPVPRAGHLQEPVRNFLPPSLLCRC